MIKTVNNTFLWLSIFVTSFTYSQIPTYYDSIDFTQDSNSLRVDINTLLSNTLTNYVYYTSSSSTDVWDVVKISDLDPNDTTNQNVLLIYGYDNTDGISENDRTRNVNLSCHTSSCIGLWNREHVYPQSLGTYDADYPGIGTDVHNIRACDSQMNSSRSNRIFEDGTGNAHITSSGNWYPGDEWKGDIARIIMYMEILYPANTWANQVGNSSNTYHTDMPDIFLQWNAEDPISDYEILRNEHIFSIQGNRNPFIDNPYIATLIWGGPVAEDTWSTLSVAQVSQLDAISVYPTLTDEYLYITSNTSNHFEYSILDIIGKQLIHNTTNNNRVDVSNLSKGHYILHLKDNNLIKTIRFYKY